MSRKGLGLDAFDVGIHVFVTICAAILFSEAGGPNDDEVIIPLVFGASAVAFAIRRRLALRKQPQGLTTGEVEAERLAELEARVGELEQAHYRVAELEERLDFSERLLAQQTRGTEARVPGQELH
jgi:hypothetical protein